LNYTANNFSTQPQNESNVEINSDKSQVNQVQKSKSRTNEHKPKYTKYGSNDTEECLGGSGFGIVRCVNVVVLAVLVVLSNEEQSAG
jgi:hypothetical protein